MADMFEFETPSGVTRYSGADFDFAWDGFIYQRGPLLQRSGVRSTVGLQSDEMTIKADADSTMLLEGLPFVQAALNGALDRARMTLKRAFFSDWGQAPVGVLTLFPGRVSNVEGTRSRVEISVKSDIELLNAPTPPNLYQPPCVHTLFSPGCGALRGAFLVNGSVTGFSAGIMATNLSQVSGWFDQGTVKFLTGANAGLVRTVKSYAAGGFTFALPLPNPPTAGDTFEALPGCDKRQATCSDKFSNLPRFGGFPYVPAPETAY